MGVYGCFVYLFGFSGWLAGQGGGWPSQKLKKGEKNEGTHN